MSDSLTPCITNRNKNVPSHFRGGTRRSMWSAPQRWPGLCVSGLLPWEQRNTGMGRIDRAGGRHPCGKDTVNSFDAPSKGNDMVTQTHVQAKESRNWEGVFNDSDAFTSCRSDNVARWPKCIKWYRQSTHFLELSGQTTPWSIAVSWFTWSSTHLSSEKGGQWTLYATLWCVRVTTVATDTQ
jgi:hypothetical protein